MLAGLADIRAKVDQLERHPDPDWRSRWIVRTARAMFAGINYIDSHPDYAVGELDAFVERALRYEYEGLPEAELDAALELWRHSMEVVREAGDDGEEQ